MAKKQHTVARAARKRKAAQQARAAEKTRTGERLSGPAPRKAPPAES